MTAQKVPNADSKRPKYTRPGHQSALVRLPKTGAVLLTIDAVSEQARPIDEDEGLVRASIRKLLDIAQQEAASLVIFGHDGQSGKP